MKPTRKTQPYRQGPRSPGQALNAMTRGRTAGGMNPADVKRAGFLIAAGKQAQSGRVARPKRAPRPPR